MKKISAKILTTDQIKSSFDGNDNQKLIAWDQFVTLSAFILVPGFTFLSCGVSLFFDSNFDLAFAPTIISTMGIVCICIFLACAGIQRNRWINYLSSVIIVEGTASYYSKRDEILAGEEIGQHKNTFWVPVTQKNFPEFFNSLSTSKQIFLSFIIDKQSRTLIERNRVKLQSSDLFLKVLDCHENSKDKEKRRKRFEIDQWDSSVATSGDALLILGAKPQELVVENPRMHLVAILIASFFLTISGNYVLGTCFLFLATPWWLSQIFAVTRKTPIKNFEFY